MSTVAELFETFLDNLSVSNRETISYRYGEITQALNKRYRDTDSKSANSLQVGSYGRTTAIDGVSDLDMIYVMPKAEWERFKDGRQSALLQEIRSAILGRYPRTDVGADGQVVVVSFDDHVFEVVPGFQEDDGSFKYPDTNAGGSWPITKPRAEIEAVSDFDALKNGNMRRLAKMVRAWKNKHGVAMGGLLIDTLAYNFLSSTEAYDEKSFLYFDELSREFFLYLSALPKQAYFLAPGSNQRVFVKKNFQSKAKIAHDLCQKAIEAEGQPYAAKRWRKVFGRPFPDKDSEELAKTSSITAAWNDTEEFIEDKFPVDIRYSLSIDCDVKQDGFREAGLREMLSRKLRLLPQKRLVFKVIECDVPRPFTLKWKVLNRGDVAKQRNEIRGQIVDDSGYLERTENTRFRGEHVVESYVIKNGVVMAKDRILVPIQ